MCIYCVLSFWSLWPTASAVNYSANSPLLYYYHYWWITVRPQSVPVGSRCFTTNVFCSCINQLVLCVCYLNNCIITDKFASIGTVSCCFTIELLSAGWMSPQMARDIQKVPQLWRRPMQLKSSLNLTVTCLLWIWRHGNLRCYRVVDRTTVIKYWTLLLLQHSSPDQKSMTDNEAVCKCKLYI